ncbi:hypothetical protein AVEN_224659-1 [Araneus ventricosus]|uniref:Transcriptional coactivator p15 (PC4) C-terminal domain-containing protein n=1 Tax=Araneus ventricosus TaxID=182803 RepID=A0A4Y2MDF1_ARAVE|nr:hypothetical protein AVEN_224659-1 [Araneus ventricosus]
MYNFTAISSKRKGALPETSIKKTRFNDKLDLSSSLSSLTLDSLPDHVIHFGGDVFTYVNTFKGQNSVHIRVYTKNDCGVLHPTKYGVSLKPSEWSDLLSKLCHLQHTKDPDAVLTIKKEACAFNHTANYNVCVRAQRLFQQKDLSFQLSPERVVLKDEQCSKLRFSRTFI